MECLLVLLYHFLSKLQIAEFALVHIEVNSTAFQVVVIIGLTTQRLLTTSANMLCPVLVSTEFAISQKHYEFLYVSRRFHMAIKIITTVFSLLTFAMGTNGFLTDSLNLKGILVPMRYFYFLSFSLEVFDYLFECLCLLRRKKKLLKLKKVSLNCIITF